MVAATKSHLANNPDQSLQRSPLVEYGCSPRFCAAVESPITARPHTRHSAECASARQNRVPWHWNAVCLWAAPIETGQWSRSGACVPGAGADGGCLRPPLYVRRHEGPYNEGRRSAECAPASFGTRRSSPAKPASVNAHRQDGRPGERRALMLTGHSSPAGRRVLSVSKYRHALRRYTPGAARGYDQG